MNIKVRFALLFTSFVSLVLIISAIAIYFLYSNFRVQDFYGRLNKEAIHSYNLFETKKLESGKKADFKKDNEFALISLQLLIFDSVLNKSFTYPDTLDYKPNTTIFKNATTLHEYRFVYSGKECLMIYIPETKHFVFTSALDVYGLRKLKNIQYILISVLLGGITLSILVSFLFVTQAFKPLKKLSNQMLLVTDFKKIKPIDIVNNKDEIGQIAKSYNAMIERLKKAFDYQNSFVNYASHELRTPLAIMLAQTEAALNNNLDKDELKNVLQSLKEDQQGIIELTNSLLLLSQYENASDNNFELLRIDEIIYDSVDEIKCAFPKILIVFDFANTPEEENLYLNGNKALLATAIKNLIKNGYLYSNDNQVKIRLFVNKERSEITVFNNGNEIPLEQRDKLFMPFFRANNIEKQKGHGLGLSIVQRIIQVHNGSIVYSTYGANTNCFTITLQNKKPVDLINW